MNLSASDHIFAVPLHPAPKKKKIKNIQHFNNFKKPSDLRRAYLKERRRRKQKRKRQLNKVSMEVPVTTEDVPVPQPQPDTDQAPVQSHEPLDVPQDVLYYFESEMDATDSDENVMAVGNTQVDSYSQREKIKRQLNKVFMEVPVTTEDVPVPQPQPDTDQAPILTHELLDVPQDVLYYLESEMDPADLDENVMAVGNTEVDSYSQRGRFGWVTLGSTHLPCLIRNTEEKYCAVRMVECELLNKYLNHLRADVYSGLSLQSFCVTESEATLLNQINNEFCEMQYGENLFSTDDLLVRVKDVHMFYTFLDFCYRKLMHKEIVGKDKCGFIQIDKESVVPYAVKNNIKFVPLFYFEGEVDDLKFKMKKLKNWDLAYLKFCCRIQGIRSSLFESDTCTVVSLEDIKGYFNSDTTFEEFYPDKEIIDSSNMLDKDTGDVGNWIKPPSDLTVPTLMSSSPDSTPEDQLYDLTGFQALYWDSTSQQQDIDSTSHSEAAIEEDATVNVDVLSPCSPVIDDSAELLTDS